ncbi:uncharacterized protein LOC130010673 [Patella vulgata]|uniref:uncharacterized protein LOC130010673 n=1 Tax=Patella vulgata TaxID=6465 RepID=UPI0024A8F895|nr:uncharacterized protein LOC130010673 [Patella vulgata]XP_055954424.1 uncharacterized protein LOC130010673 [Patella vulgata]
MAESTSPNGTDEASNGRSKHSLLSRSKSLALCPPRHQPISCRSNSEGNVEFPAGQQVNIGITGTVNNMIVNSPTSSTSSTEDLRAKWYLSQGKHRSVESKACKVGLKRLMKYSCCCIVGGPRSGKNEIANKIISTFIANNKTTGLTVVPVLIDQPSDLGRLNKSITDNSHDKYLLFFKDMFGCHRVSDLPWDRYLDFLDKKLEKKVISVIVTSRTMIYQKLKSSLKSSSIFHKNTTILLHHKEYIYTIADKREMLKATKVPLEEFTDSAISQISDIAFLECLNTYQTKGDNSGKEVENFKTQQLNIILAWLDDLQRGPEQRSYIALLAVLLHNGSWNWDQRYEISPRKCSVLEAMKSTYGNFDPDDVQKACEDLTGTFLLRDDSGSYTYIEDIVGVAVLHLAWRKWHSRITDTCSLRIILEWITTACNVCSDQDRTTLFETLACRMQKESSNEQGCVLKHSAFLTGSFLKPLFEHLPQEWKSKISKRLFLDAYSQIDALGFQTLVEHTSSSFIGSSPNGINVIELVLHSEVDRVEKLVKLLERHPSLPSSNLYGKDRTILHYTAELWNADQIQTLLKSNPTLCVLLNIGDTAGQTPFHVACLAENGCDIIHCLHDAGADVNSVDNQQKTALHLVTQKGGDVEKIELLLRLGACANMKDENDRSPLHCAVNAKNIDAVRVLLGANVDVTLEDEDEDTPLSLACSLVGDQEAIVKLLIDHRSDINHTNHYSQTCLFLATESQNVNVVRCLLMNDADVNFPSANGSTSLHKAISSKKRALELVKLLVEHGADINLKDQRGETVLDKIRIRKEFQNLEAVKHYLLRYC